MGGGDLNMKKSWHPLLLTNQQRVWEVEKKAHEEKKKLEQLRKELEEERQLAELQRLQEEATGKKRTEKLDWMYATPSGGEGGALGGQRLGEKDMEDFLLGKKRVDEVLKQGDQNIGAASKDFIAVQNANSAQDLASKIREDPLLAIKQQEQAALQAMMHNPAMRKRIKEMKAKKEGKEGESKEERKERKRREKEERKLAKKETKHGHSHTQRPYTDSEGSRSRSRSRSPPRHNSRRSYHDDRDYDRSRSGRYDDRDDRRGGYDRYREHSRSSPSGYKRDEYRDSRPRDYERDGRDRNGTNGFHRHESERRRSPDYNHRTSGPNGRDVTPLGAHSTANGHSGPSGRINRPTASAIMDRPAAAPPSGPSAEEARAARLAQMTADAADMSSSRLTKLEQRRKEEEAQFAAEERERQRLGKGDTKGAYVREQERIMLGGGADAGVGVGMGLAEALGRRGGRGLQRE